VSSNESSVFQQAHDLETIEMHFNLRGNNGGKSPAVAELLVWLGRDGDHNFA
jgi:hypothetical protein